MDTMQLIERATRNNTIWVAFLFIGSFTLVAILRSVFEKQFNDFLGLIYTNKYIKLYGSENNFLSWFSILLIIIQLISYSFFILIILGELEYTDKENFVSYLGIFGFITLFVFSKFLIEKGVAVLFGIQEFYNRFLFQQLTYRMYFGLFLLLGTFILFYNSLNLGYIIYILIGLFLLLHLIIYFIVAKNFQKEITGNLFYFILYICTLEIAPYYFIYYWLTKH